MGLFGLSPLVLSFLAGSMFNTSGEELDVAGYARFLAVLTLIIHLLGAILLHVPVSTPADTGEAAPLLPSQGNLGQEPKQSVGEVLLDHSFWLLAATAGITIGSVGAVSGLFSSYLSTYQSPQSEMVISNIGSIVMSLPSSISPTSNLWGYLPASASPVAVTAGQIRLFSASNTISRIVVGSVADWVSPVGLPGSVLATRKRLSRLSFLMGFSGLLTVVYTYLVAVCRTQEQLWPLRFVLQGHHNNSSQRLMHAALVSAFRTVLSSQ